MKKYLFIILLGGDCFSENLTFVNSNDTIVFKYKDLININHDRFRFLSKDGDILNLTRETMFKSDTVKMHVNNIKSFQSYERYRLSNVREQSNRFSSYLGCSFMTFGFMTALGMFEVLGNDLNILAALLASGSFGMYGGSLGYFYGGIYGFLSYGEGEINLVKNGNWKIK